MITSILRLLRSQDGAALPVIGFSIGVLVLAAGGAIDAGRAHLVEAKLSSSLDAAGLAAGSTINTANYQTEVSKYFYANYPTGYLDSTVTDLSSSINAENTLITLSATATVPTTLLQLAGIDNFTITVNSEITRASKGLELVLVVDNSGSMASSAGGGYTRLEALQSASNTLLDILFGSETTAQNLYVGIVPFSQAVNIGSSHTDWVNDNGEFWGAYSWDGCVEARFSTSRDTTDDPPTTEKFDKYYAQCLNYYYYYISWINAWYGKYWNNYKDCATGYGAYYRSGVSNTTYGPNQYCPTEVTRLTSTKATLTTAISNLQAAGATHTNMGVVWAWRMLSPNWQGVWGGEMDTNSLPLAYGTDNMEKAVIILSDGDNYYGNYNYTAYEYLSNGNLGTTSSSSSDNKLDDRTESVCDSMKNNNIIVYTVAFGTSISTQGKALMQYCASKSEYYFESPSVSDLETAFQTIGDSLANLRVSK